MQIGLLVIATGKYTCYIPPLLESVRQHFLPGHNTTMFCFTDSQENIDGTVKLPIQHRPWPGSTLYRYHAFADHREQLSKMDYVYYCDADMRFVAKVGDEILGNLVGTIHPGFYNRPKHEFSYERRPESHACMRHNEGHRYYAGGFNGGKTEIFLKMADTIRRWVDADTQKGITPVWHDESCLNKYLFIHPPQVVLSPSYCFPESWHHLPFEKKLLALDKNHAEMRS